jgi:hypothetical protein
MKKIKLVNQMLFALVDDEDYEMLSRYDWYKVRPRTVTYAYTKINNRTVYMHQLILPIPSKDLTVDHIDNDGLNNVKSNLRLATRTQQSQNRRKQINGITSKYKGVRFHNRDHAWEANIVYNGKHIYLGSFDTEIAAAKAFNRAAKRYHGEFASLNVIEEGEKTN